MKHRLAITAVLTASFQAAGGLCTVSY